MIKNKIMLSAMVVSSMVMGGASCAGEPVHVSPKEMSKEEQAGLKESMKKMMDQMRGKPALVVNMMMVSSQEYTLENFEAWSREYLPTFSQEKMNEALSNMKKHIEINPKTREGVTQFIKESMRKNNVQVSDDKIKGIVEQRLLLSKKMLIQKSILEGLVRQKIFNQPDKAIQIKATKMLMKLKKENKTS